MDNPESVMKNGVVGVIAEKEVEEKKLEDDVEEVENFDGNVG